MANNDFSTEVAENYDQKCLCVLVLDVSGSMDGQPIRELNQGLQDFYNEISKDYTSSQRVEVAIIKFNHETETIQEPSLVDNFSMPVLTASGSTATVNAVKDAIDLVEARKGWYKTTNQSYHRPWIILMTDGVPDDNQDVDELGRQIKQDTADKKYVFLPIGVGKSAAMMMLHKLKGTCNGEILHPMKLKGTKFSSFFKWLSASIGSTINQSAGSEIKLNEVEDSCMDGFEI